MRCRISGESIGRVLRWLFVALAGGQQDLSCRAARPTFQLFDSASRSITPSHRSASPFRPRLVRPPRVTEPWTFMRVLTVIFTFCKFRAWRHSHKANPGLHRATEPVAPLALDSCRPPAPTTSTLLLETGGTDKVVQVLALLNVRLGRLEHALNSVQPTVEFVERRAERQADERVTR